MFGSHEVKLWMKEDEEKMEKEQEKFWMSRGYFFLILFTHVNEPTKPILYLVKKWVVRPNVKWTM